MPTNSSELLNNRLRFDKGVAGFIDLITLVNEEQTKVFEKILAPAGQTAHLFFTNLLELGKFSTACEIKVRENERFIKLKRTDLTEAFDVSASALNQQSVGHAGRALKFVNQMLDDLNHGGALLKLRDAHKNPEFSKTLVDAKEAFLHNALQFNFTNNEEFMEILGIWDKATSQAQNEGVTGIFSGMSSSLEAFISRRNTKERGTNPASPLPWWKYVLISLIVGAAIFAIIACFVWFACTWAWPAIAAATPFIFTTIQMGC